MNFKQLGDNLGLEEDEYRELIELFVVSGNEDFELLRQALAAGDADQVMRRAHTIKGASSNLGLNEISAQARIIEEQAMQKQLGDLESTVQELKKQMDVMQSYVQI